MPWPLPESEAERLALALGYPYDAPPQSYHLKNGELSPIEAADFTDRVPVIGHGSNRAPAQLIRKFGGTSADPGRDWELPVTFGWLQDYDVVYSAHVTRYGAIASTLVHCPGAKAWVAVNWLDAAQLRRMHETEGRSYPYGKLAGAAVELAGGPSPVIEAPHVYHSRYGTLLEADAPIGLAAAKAEGRPHLTMSQEEVQRLIHGRHYPDLAFEAHVLASIADPDHRSKLIAAMEAHARPAHAPHFVELDPLEEFL